ncbi:3-dehydroquinate synthase family protein [Streptomyces bambusae]|uniref:3-dehydroquinate synthase C-terminal domain-containing protein n=1 Tax=Streptomyces bambusae TaxID=1550616 RepID=A0ABS6ZD56_9ACTN|nr:hypothetical protein [Streptomyces bambusae]MBW5484671.1 hypothetical protein [Streptomyces bambusae]
MPEHRSPVVLDRAVQAGPAHFPVHIRHGGGDLDGSLAELTEVVRGLGHPRTVLLTHPALPTRHVALVLRHLGAAAPADVLWPARPEGHVGRPARSSGPSRRSDLSRPGRDGARRAGAGPVVPDGSLVVALGGTRTLAAAGRVRRADGTRPPVLRLPTTLRAMTDSALSVAGDGNGCAAPVLVRVQLEFLETLPARDVCAGLSAPAAVVLAVVPASREQVAARLRRDGRYDPAVLASFVVLSVQARAALLCYDPQEDGPGAAFGYGRAVARALRAEPDADLRHGAAEALGIRVAARVSRLAGLLDAEGERAHADLLDRAGLPRSLPPRVSVESVLDALVGDGAGAGLVLLDRLGQPHVHRGRLVTPVDAGLLRAGLATIAPQPAAPPAPAATAPATRAPQPVAVP